MKRLAALFFVAVLATSSLAEARTLCCEIYNGAACFASQTGSCPSITLPSQAWISVAVPSSNPLNASAVVQVRYAPPFEGLCFVENGTAVGQYTIPSVCVKLVKPPGTLRPLITVSEEFVPYGGHAFAFEASNNWAMFFNEGLYSSCFLQADLKDDWGVTRTPQGGSGYTCSPMRQMTFSTSGVGGGQVHYLPGVSTAPILGTRPRLTTSTAYHQVGQPGTFHVRVGRPHTGVLWTRSVNNQTVQPLVSIGTTDINGSLDLTFPPWAAADAGANAMFVLVFQSTSNVLNFPVAP